MRSNTLLIICLLSMKHSEEVISFPVCTAVGHIGVSNPSAYGTQSGSQVSGYNTDTAYLITDPDTTFPCCGVIEEWEAYVKESGVIKFDIWRSIDASNLKLVGSNELNPVIKDGTVVYNVPPGAQYTVYPGDYIGWYTPLKEIMAYTPNITGEATDVHFFKLRPSSLSLGLSLDWSTAESQSGNTYLIRARYGVNTPPTFLNLDAQITVFPAEMIGTVIYTISATDSDISDTTITQLVYRMISGNGLFLFNPATTGNIQLNKNLNYESVSGYDLYITVTDGYSTVTDTLSVNISGINIPPKFTNLPLATDLYVEENKMLGSSVYDVRAIDNDGDSLMYSMMSIPGTGLIYFSIDSASGLISTSTLNAINYEAMRDKVFVLKISVTDGKLTEFQTLVIRISNVNEGLSFSQNTYRIVASGRMAGTQLPNPGFVVIDDDGRDTRTFRHDCGADTGYLTMNTENGILAFAVDYDREVPGKPTRITCVVTATDSGGLTATTTLSITLSLGLPDSNSFVSSTQWSVEEIEFPILREGNAPPKFTNLPLTSDLYVPENTVIGSSVYKVSATDNDEDALTYSMVSYPGTGGFYFSINSTSGMISTSAVNTINYETISDKDFAFTVSVTDGKLTESQNLTIRIFDVNEGPSFAQNIYRIVANEGLAGTQLPDPGFIINDVDIGDTVTFLYNCGPNTGYFTMNSVNARLTFAVEYDLDVPGQPTLITCTITGIDNGGLTATATLSLSMRDVNDNTPTFQHYLYTFYAHSDSTVGTVLGSISATDADSGQNGQIVYSTDQTGLTQTYFDVSSTGQVILKRNLNGIGVGTILPFTAHATDVGSPSRTGSTSVKIIVIG